MWLRCAQWNSTRFEKSARSEKCKLMALSYSPIDSRLLIRTLKLVTMRRWSIGIGASTYDHARLRLITAVRRKKGNRTKRKSLQIDTRDFISCRGRYSMIASHISVGRIRDGNDDPKAETFHGLLA